jgi:[acyl-carrier-protein] S-malonyltransferase
MDEARAAFAEDLATVALGPARLAVVSNSDARAYRDAEGWRQRLAEHLVRPVRWRQSVEHLAAAGATQLVEVGPGSTLAGLARRIVPSLAVSSVEVPLEEVRV